MEKKRKYGAISISVRMASLMLISILFYILIIFTANYNLAKEELKNAEIRNMTGICSAAITIMDSLNKQVDEGSLPLDKAQETARILLNGPKLDNNSRDMKNVRLKHGNDGYLLALNSKKVAVMHPFLEGKDMTGVMSADGKVDLMDEMTKQKSGTKIIEYKWTNSSDEAARSKISVTQYYEPWDWFVTVSGYADEVNAASGEILIGLLPWGIAALLLSILLSYFISIRLAKPIVEASAAMNVIAQGDLSGRMSSKSKDETGLLVQNINKASEKLSSMFKNILNMSREIDEFASMLDESSKDNAQVMEQIGITISSIATGMTEQATAAQEGAQKVSELDNGIKNIYQNTQIIEESIIEMRTAKEKGIKIAEELKIKSSETNETISEVAKGIFELSSKSNEINKIVAFISDIANKTNLLSLNAAIEAARAGEMGKGFAVVANEVRNLAEQSQQSVKEISSLIYGIQSDVNANTVIMHETIRIGAEQVKMVESTYAAFNNIALSIDVILNGIENVTNLLNNMQKESGAIVDSINDISAVSQESSASIEEISAAAEEQIASFHEISNSIELLSNMALEMQQTVQELKLS